MRKNIGSYFFTLKGGGAYDPDQVKQEGNRQPMTITKGRKS